MMAVLPQRQLQLDLIVQESYCYKNTLSQYQISLSFAKAESEQCPHLETSYTEAWNIITTLFGKILGDASMAW